MDHAGRLIPKMNLPSGLHDPEQRARAAWPRAAGKVVASHTRVRSLVRGTLVVEVGDYVWQRQLSTLTQCLLRNLEKELAEPLVTGIDFRPMRHMPVRREPQMATSSRRESSQIPGQIRGQIPSQIKDPVLALLYERSKSAQAAGRGTERMRDSEGLAAAGESVVREFPERAAG
jgi:Dna[CI] antecedent, DciA